MNHHRVSIIMAVKDTAPYLHECLDSVIAQTYKNWELIAVNDHSTDNSKSILEQYASKDPRIRVFDGKREKLIPILKEAYQYSTGSLINRMDSDDKMPSYKLQVLVEEWKKYGEGNIIAGGTEHFVDNGEVGEGFLKYEKWLNRVAKNNLHLEEIYRECVIPSHCWIIHRNDFNKADAFNPEVYPEDYDLCFRFYKNDFNIIGIDKVLHYWRDRSERISRNWEEYKDNRYFKLKLRYFIELDRDHTRPLVIWGAGKNGKDFAKILIEVKQEFHWTCENNNKIGHNVYGIILEDAKNIDTINNPQLLIVVSSPDEKEEIRQRLLQMDKLPIKDFWFFL